MQGRAGDIGIVGYGFSGGMVLANLVRRLPGPAVITLFDPSAHGMRGTAYATGRLEHVLNVRAAGMGAFTDAPGGFYAWLQGDAGKRARAARGIQAEIAPTDFAPRCLYGDYLEAIQQETLALAAAKNITVQWVREEVTALAYEGAQIALTTSGGAYRGGKLALATGNLFRAEDAALVRQPWFFDFTALSAKRVAVIGTGLTAVDTLLSLMAAKYQGEITCISRHGWLPQPHASAAPLLPDIHLDGLGEGRLSARLARLREIIAAASARGIAWQSVMDAVRARLPEFWQSVSAQDKARFLSRYFTLWNVHRHRLDPALHRKLQEALAAGRICMIKARFSHWEKGEAVTSAGRVPCDVVFDCTGPSYRALPAFAASFTRHATGAGLVEYGEHRVSPMGAPAVYALGNLLLGSRLETTAVPELRAQAARVAELLSA